LILSVRGAEADKIAALDVGADDYLTKPFATGELLARLRAIQRRAQSAEESSAVRFGSVEVDFARRFVSKGGAEVRLTAKEYSLLRLLLVHRGKVLTHRQILRELWGPKAEEQTHYLRVYMAHLRQKLEMYQRAAVLPHRIGYRLPVQRGIGPGFSCDAPSRRIA